MRLDAWHFMRRFSSAANTTAHLLFERFSSDLSRAIFAYDEEDLERLVKAKREQLEARGFLGMTRAAILHCLSKKELHLHCSRVVRPVQELEQEITKLLAIYLSESKLTCTIKCFSF